jgi:putative transposase
MDNHIHLIATPKKTESLAKAIGETHKKFTTMINIRHNWKGYL